MSLYDDKGQRLYLTPEERLFFIEQAKTKAKHNDAMTFSRFVGLTGCRISEATELMTDRIDFVKNEAVVRTLKKRKKKGIQKQVWRSIPLPADFLFELNLVHKIKDAKSPTPIWGVTRETGWVWIKEIMKKSDIVGAHATPKGLRHAFAVACVEKDVPLPTIQKLLGHSSSSTTAIYLDLVGKEQRDMISRIW